MPPEVYRAVIDEAHKRGLRVPPRFYLADAGTSSPLGVYDRPGVRIDRHGVRRPISPAAFAPPTLMRGVAFAYADERVLRRSLLQKDADP